MRVELNSGRYVVAVSGGVDSMVLLDLLAGVATEKSLELIVAHFDHGIRQDSALDRQLVEGQAQKLGLPFYCERQELGEQASEDLARQQRYRFLRRIKQETKAQAIITAHHQDDLIETALLNLIRGTNRKGLTSLGSRDDLLRPLIDVTKGQILEYAQSHNIIWREDSTNSQLRYKRNLIRQKIVAKMSLAQRAEIVALIANVKSVNQQIDEILLTIVDPSSKHQSRQLLLAPEFKVGLEILATWLRAHGFQLSRQMLYRNLALIRTLPIGRKIVLGKNGLLVVGKDDVRLEGLTTDGKS